MSQEFFDNYKKYITIQSRVDTAANWQIANPILAEREIGYESTTGRYKIGNGTIPWNGLDYVNIGANFIGSKQGLCLGNGNTIDEASNWSMICGLNNTSGDYGSGVIYGSNNTANDEGAEGCIYGSENKIGRHSFATIYGNNNSAEQNGSGGLVAWLFGDGLDVSYNTEGYENIVALGTYAKIPNEPVYSFVLGNGTSENDHKNTMTISADGKKIQFSGQLYMHSDCLSPSETEDESPSNLVATKADITAQADEIYNVLDTTYTTKSYVANTYTTKTYADNKYTAKGTVLPITGGTVTGKLVATPTDATSSQVRNIKAGATSLTPGVSTLETGTLYFVYET